MYLGSVVVAYDYKEIKLLPEQALNTSENKIEATIIFWKKINKSRLVVM
jgi:hypothetical protein